MKIGFLITARLKSTRLKKKLLLKVQGKEYIRWMIDRIKLTQSINELIICTSTNSEDDKLEEIALEEYIKCYRGSEEDVIYRLSEASEKFNLDYILNITADCPLVSYEYIDKVINKYKDSNIDLIRTLDLPHGLFVYGIKPEALKEICRIKTNKHTEVWGKYFEEIDHLKTLDLKIPECLQRDYRLTLDYPEDHEFFKQIYSYFGKDTYSKSIKDIISFLDNNPEVVAINKECHQKYLKRWNSQK